MSPILYIVSIVAFCLSSSFCFANSISHTGHKPSGVFYEGLNQLNLVEEKFIKKTNKRLNYQQEKLRVVEVESSGDLGKLSALSFLQWVHDNPNGVVALPSGKNAEYFIKYLYYYLKNWHKASVQEDLKQHGIEFSELPNTSNLKLVQMDEFYPLSNKQGFSYASFIKRYYINILKLEKHNVLTINLCQHGIVSGKGGDVVFQNNEVNLSLLNREPKNKLEQWQKQALIEANEYCNNYDKKIRNWGGIGFALINLGVDGNINFNLPGTSLKSQTRVVKLNYPTAASIAKDFGGIDNVSGKAAIAVGLDTLTFNKSATIIAFAIGEDRAQAVKNMVENRPSYLHPATILQNLPNSRVYLAKGAAKYLKGRYREYINDASSSGWRNELLEEIITKIALKQEKEILSLTREDIRKHQSGQLLLASMPTNVNLQDILRIVRDRIIEKINLGLEEQVDKVFVHTCPHPDDIIFSYEAKIYELASYNANHIVCFTSGFNGVTDSYINQAIGKIYEDWLDRKKVYLFEVPYSVLLQSFSRAYFANDTAKMEKIDKFLLIKNFIISFNIKDINELKQKLRWLKDEYFQRKKYGDKDIKEIVEFKSRIRETEINKIYDQPKSVFKNYIVHLRSNFYSADLFSRDISFDKDVVPFKNILDKVNPDYITISDVPQGIHPVANFKSMSVVVDAINNSNINKNNLKIWGYRNIWIQYPVFEANMFIPVSVEELSEQKRVFTSHYSSQIKTPYPSPFYNGDLINLSIKNQQHQFEMLKTLLGDSYFANSSNPKLSSASGFIFIKEMSIEELEEKTKQLETPIEFDYKEMREEISTL